MTKNTGWIAADDVNRLVREIDVALNGVGAAPQAKLCDVTAQVKKAAREFGPILQVLGTPPKPAGAVPLIPEGWQITCMEDGSIKVNDADGSWLRMPESTSQPGRASLEMRLLYGLAEAMLSAPRQAAAECGTVKESLTVAEGAGREAVAWEERMRPVWDQRSQWTPWERCSRESYENFASKPQPWIYNDWEIQRRALYTEADPSPAADTELIERFRIAARALIGIRQPSVPEWQKRPVYAEDLETMVDVLHALEGLAQQPAVSDTTAALIDMLRQRDATGLIKYGKTLDRTDLSQAEWLQHMAEELLDGAGYALAAIRTLKNKGA